MASRRILIQKTDRLLSNLLGCLDGLYEPWRMPYGTANALNAVDQFRYAYRSNGLSWPTKASRTAASRAHHQRSRELLAERGYAVTMEGGKVSLTPLGHARARRLTGSRTCFDCLDMLNRLVYLTPIVPRASHAKELVMESEWFDRPYPKDGRVCAAYAQDIDDVMALLVGGYVESTTDTPGHLYYFVNWESLSQADIDADLSVCDVAESEEAMEIYFLAYEKTHDALKSAEPPNPSCVSILASASPNRFPEPDDWQPGDFRPENYNQEQPTC